MNKKELFELKKKISKLSNIEKVERDIKLRNNTIKKDYKMMAGFPSIDKPWLQYYPEEAIKAEIPSKTAYEMIYSKMHNRSNLIALNYFGNKITYKELFDQIDRVTKSLKEIGVKPRDVVTLAMPTSPELVYTFYAINRLGAISNCIDPRLTEAGFKESIKESNSKFLISVDMCSPIIKNLIENIELNKVVMISPLESAPLPIKLIARNKKVNINNNQVLNWDTFINLGKNGENIIDFPYQKDYPVTIVHTGGTTGKPKGVLLTNDNFNAMAYTQEISNYNQAERDRFLTFLPPFIAYCLVNAIHDPLYLGFENVLVPMFSPNDFPKLMKKYKPNHVLAGPILWNVFIKDKKVKKENLDYLKSPISGGDVLNIELEREINTFFKNHGCKYNIIQGYGMTEVSAAAIYSKPNSYKEGSVGIPYVKNNIGIFNPETGEELGYDTEGEICISSPTLMLGYLNNEKETSKIIEFKEDGLRWIHTGDLGKIDSDGNLFVKGRMKRMIVRNGNKLFPSTIENIIKANPAIDMCAIVQMENDKDRHVPIAHIIIKDEFKGMEEEIVSLVEKSIGEKLPDFNIPYSYVFRSDMPLTNIQKVDYRKLEDESINYKNSIKKIHYNYKNNEMAKQKEYK